jgi:hypothetical protein
VYQGGDCSYVWRESRERGNLGSMLLFRQGDATICVGATVVCALFVARHCGDKAGQACRCPPTSAPAGSIWQPMSLLRMCITILSRLRAPLQSFTDSWRARVPTFVSCCLASVSCLPFCGPRNFDCPAVSHVTVRLSPQLQTPVTPSHGFLLNMTDT